jgi:adenosylcobinamide-GDP ribazoletransferase
MLTPFTVAAVPTGMKRGVCTGPWGVWKQPQRARVWGQRAEIVKGKGAEMMAPLDRCSDARGRLHLGHLRPPNRMTHPRERDSAAGPAWLRDLAGAWIFYSVLPAWPWPKPRFQRIARFAPWVGAVLGLLQGLLWWGLEGRVPLLAQVALVLAAGLLLSGGLHMDGAMDTADGLAAGERLLEAMEDSRVGASGSQALVLLLLMRTAALASLGPAAPLALPWAALWGRVAPLVAMARFPYLRPGGTAGFHREHWAGLARELRPTALLLVPLLLGGLGAAGAILPGTGARAALAGLAGLLPALVVPLWLGRRLGGHSGDSYGACVEWSEALALLLSAAIGLGGAAGPAR